MITAMRMEAKENSSPNPAIAIATIQAITQKLPSLLAILGSARYCCSTANETQY
jgi:hypothetical protein